MPNPEDKSCVKCHSKNTFDVSGKHNQEGGKLTQLIWCHECNTTWEMVWMVQPSENIKAHKSKNAALRFIKSFYEKYAV